MLPGKLCIGILEEDNPLKAYFRLKPLLVENDGRYEPYDGAEVYPEDGCIRIVPDKNESSHFKARMRRMGRYCVLDLREHAGENDKIRPNKNYRGDDTERNAHIVYSDVVREPAENMIFEIAAELQPGEWSGAAPGTPRLLCADSLETWAYTPPAEDGGAGTVALDGETLVEEELQRFEIPGFSGETLRFAIRLPGTMPSVIGAPKLRPERPVPSPQPIAAPQPAIQASASQAEPQAQPAPAADKPWISRELPIAPPVRGRITNLRQSLEAQSGLNPRRSRSLQEIIEEKWRHSRVDQLGHPVPANATGQPVESPLDKALDALRDAWQLPELRKRLLSSISEMDEFSDALTDLVRRERDGALRRDLEELEAERLKSLDEVDKLRREKQELRETFKREIREEEEAAFRDAVERTRAAQEECERQEAAAREARKAASSAEDFLAALNDGRFEDKLKDFAFTSRAVELLTHPKEAPAPQEEISDETPTAAEWIERTRRAFAVEGLEIDAMHAANLLICVALSDSLLLSGPAASDKNVSARALARALGALRPGRCMELCGKMDGAELKRPSELPRVALVRGANNRPRAEIDRGLCGFDQNLLVIATLNDSGSGYPVCAEALERGFFVRMQPAPAHTPWRPAVRINEDFSPVRMDALRAAFLDDSAELPAGLERRLQKLRDALAQDGVRLSRWTLNLMWRYCAAVIKLNKISAGEALDLAFAQKALPCILAEAPMECLIKLRGLLSGMPHSLALLDAPLPILI